MSFLESLTLGHVSPGAWSLFWLASVSHMVNMCYGIADFEEA